jgi:plastocyanin
MRHRLRQGISARSIRVAVGGAVAAAMAGTMGVAGASQQAAETVISTDASTQFLPSTAAINTGDTVVWNFPAAGVHNAVSSNDVPADPNWKDFVTSAPPSRGEYRYTFTQPGTYTFLCEVHAGMEGTVTVTGSPVTPTPTPSPTTTATPSPTASPIPTASPTATPSPSGNTPPPGGQGSTPAPAGIARADSGAPALSSLRVKAVRHGARVAFKLSESATVTLRVKKRKSGKVVRTLRLQARAGTRTVTVRGARIKRGRYTIELQARDASGNSSPLARSNVRVAR